ncbi:nucleoside hydrolase [Bacillus benzoevorans]|uniref:Inosine-uridine nucleoside N-ribohydrolase n=1 Tax=Bacillus benzoevorans TaxID=1456 RepID=A0A7X0HRV9_9BACI|nr:nucleoside hydrolase [Bacillus benzoevorans]MBB6445606.1 inosine-uridine nucleoside N-ribohydrolase [Bacillus benzoevorans]
MKKVLYDCDNTMGLPFKDVDDGLTLMYLIGNRNIDLLGVTTTFGNSHIEDVFQATTKLVNDLSIGDIPLKKGAGKGSDRKSEAAAFLVQMVNQYPNEITILATGSLTNLYGAYELDPEFYQKIKEIVLMGGLTKPLIINGRNLDELNFSVDSEASCNVLHSGAKITTMTGHICLQAEFRRKEYERLMENKDIASYAYIKEQSYAWYENFKELFATEGFFNWDIVSGVYITHPELFADSYQSIISSERDLQKGFLRIEGEHENGSIINIPTEIKDTDLFNEIIFEAWKKVKIKGI